MPTVPCFFLEKSGAVNNRLTGAACQEISTISDDAAVVTQIPNQRKNLFSFSDTGT